MWNRILSLLKTAWFYVAVVPFRCLYYLCSWSLKGTRWCYDKGSCLNVGEWIRRITVFLLWIAFLYYTIKLVSTTPLNPIAWAAYTNAKWGSVLWNISVPLLVLWLWDKAYPGNTISTIMDISKDSDIWRIAIAAGFTAVIFLGICYLVTST